MSGICLFVPKEEMLQQAHHILEHEDYIIDDIKFINTSDAVSEARSALASGINIIIARGYQASLIKQYTKIPLVEIVLTGQEMGILITKAKKLVKKENPVIAIVGFRNMFQDMSYFNEIYNIELKTYLANDTNELIVLVDQAINDNVDIIIGGDIAIAAAAKAGIPNLFLSSTEDSIREAFKVAQKMKYMSDTEMKNIAQLETLLDYSFSGIIKMNNEGNILIVNHVMQEILQKRADDVIGKHITEIIKDIEPSNIEEVLTEGNNVYSTFIRINDIALVVIIAAVKVENKIDGAILSCHRVKKIKQVETETFRELYLSGYIAQGDFKDIIHFSKEMQKCIGLARVYAQSRNPVLLCGEIGTEKDLFAQSIHNSSLYKNGPFVSVNCYGITDEMQSKLFFGDSATSSSEKEQGALAMANHGTILIHEIDKMSMNCQYRLVKAIRYKSLIRNDVEKTMSLDVRVIATTTKNLSAMISEGLFREDLYYILHGLIIDIPPLRKRGEDLEYFLDSYIKEYCNMYSRYHVLTTGAKKILLGYSWHGNIIQLESFCERLILTANHRTLDEIYVTNLINDLYPSIHTKSIVDIPVSYKDPEAQTLKYVLERHNGNRALAAEELGISKTTLWRHMKKYGIASKYESFNGNTQI